MEEGVHAYRELEAQLQQHQRIQNQKKARLQVLSSMEQEHEGFSRGVRSVLNARNQWKERIWGVVAELFTVDDAYVTALETALGGALQDIITKDARAAQDVIGYLKKIQGGRATFLPLDTLRPRPLGGTGKKQPWGAPASSALQPTWCRRTRSSIRRSSSCWGRCWWPTIWTMPWQRPGRPICGCGS